MKIKFYQLPIEERRRICDDVEEMTKNIKNWEERFRGAQKKWKMQNFI